MKRLTSKVALITADDQRFSNAVALAFGREGASVVIAGPDPKALEAAALAVRETGAECLSVVMDPVSAESCEQGMAKIAETYGQLDVLCNLAGEFPLTGPIHEVTADMLDRAVAANIKSVLLVSRFAVPLLRQSEAGSIINLSHVAALNGVPGTGLIAATKGALLNMTRDMAIQGQREGFRVNCVCVGSTFVPVIPSLMDAHRQKQVSPTELAPTLVYLACDDSRHMNGHILALDDGMHAWRDDSQRTRIVEQQIAEGTRAVPKASPPVTDRLLDGQVALITAGGGGIALATAKLFAANGAKIVLSDINLAAAESAAAEVRAKGGEATALAADVLVGEECARAVAKTVERYGKLDVLINLVGFFGKGGGTVDKVSLEEWDWMMDINLKSVFLMSKHAIPEMLKVGRGAIVNTGTLAAVIGRGGGPCYGASKSGVLALTRAMAADYFEQGIRVNTVCPSGTDTAMFFDCVLAGRVEAGMSEEQAKNLVRRGDQGLSTPDEIAPSYLFLASDQLSRKISGHILLTDNGFSGMRL